MEFKEGEIAAIGKVMYENIRDEMEEKYWGWMVVIDVKSGDYEIAEDDITGILRLLERQPDAMTWGELVGYNASCAIGGSIKPLRDRPQNRD